MFFGCFRPSGVEKASSSFVFSSTGICQKPFSRSSLEKMQLPCRWSNITSGNGSGWESGTVTTFTGR